MDIVNITTVTEFKRRHADSRKVLERWEKLTEAANWKGFTEVRQTFPATDYIKGLYCFDIGGNNYRLIASIDFAAQTVEIAMLMTHSDYDKWKA